MACSMASRAWCARSKREIEKHLFRESHYVQSYTGIDHGKFPSINSVLIKNFASLKTKQPFGSKTASYTLYIIHCNIHHTATARCFHNWERYVLLYQYLLETFSFTIAASCRNTQSIPGLNTPKRFREILTENFSQKGFLLQDR